MSPGKRTDRGTAVVTDAPRTNGESAVPPALVDDGREVERGAVRPRVGAGSPEPELSGTGLSYRHNWGPRRGQWTLRLNWSAVTPQSHVFVSIGEGAGGGPDAGKFIGAARYTLHNVAPRAGGVDIVVNVEWGSDILLYADYLVVNPTTVPTRTVQVTVHRHNTVALSDADADRILNDMGAILQNSHSPSDVVTRVQFVRNGAVRVLPGNVPATIQTQADWNTLMSAGTGVKVVQSIRWCGGPGGSIIGCAPVGNPTVNLAVVRFTANQEGILWVHEYGHNAGNPHRTDDARAVMFPSIGADHNVVNGTESGRFLAGPVAITGALMPMETSCSHGEAVQPPNDVREFVSQHWIEGVPYEAASQYTEADARRLLEWLVEEPEKHEEFLPEIVTTLCYIGSEVAVAPLIDFVERPWAGRAVFNAKNAALIHLGNLVNRSGSRAALDFLARVATDMETARALAEPQASVSAADAAARGVVAPTVEALGAEMAVSATFGLSLAGTPDAAKTIERLRDDPGAYASVNQAAAEASDIARTVRDRGHGE
ncbi:MAG: hypothetical protein AB1941_02000 [Gemmatimonadota bacterium]